MKFIGVTDKEMQAKIEAIHAETVKLAIKPTKRSAGKRALFKSARSKRAETDGIAFLDRLQVDLSTTLRSCAGRARLNYVTGEIRIQLHYRLLNTSDKELRSTYLHELAHILANMWYAYSCNHDENWKQVARLLGDDAGRCHTMDVSAYKRKAKRFEYSCGCRTWHLTARKHAKRRAYMARTGKSGYYSCPSCKKYLMPYKAPIMIDKVSKA